MAFSYKSVMCQSFIDTITVYIVSYIFSHGFGFSYGIAHRNTVSGFPQHAHIINTVTESISAFQWNTKFFRNPDNGITLINAQDRNVSRRMRS